MFIYLFIFNHLLHGDTITFKCKSTKSTPAIVGLQKKNKIKSVYLTKLFS